MKREKLFGAYIRQSRESLKKNDPAYSLRQVAGRVGIEPAYLSKIERGEQNPPSEETIRKLAKDLGENTDVLLAMGGKVSSDLLRILIARPKLFAELIRQIETLPEDAILHLVREVRDGDW